MALTGANLISYWSLEEASGTRVDAVVASGNDLTDNNTVTQAIGKIGNAAQFTAANLEYLSRADNASLSTGDIDFCLAGWVYMDSLSNRMLWGKYSAAPQLEYIVYYNTTNQVPNNNCAFIVSSNGTALTTLHASTFGAFSTATWYFVVVYHDSVNNLLGISVNDTLNTASYSSGVFDGTTAFQVGQIGGATFPMNGRIDELAFWKGAGAVPTAADITDLYNAGSGRDYTYVAAMGAAAGQPTALRHTLMRTGARRFGRGIS